MVLAALAALCPPAFAQELRDDAVLSPRGEFPAGPLRNLDHALAAYGIRPSFTYIGEALGNADGGLRRGAVYLGRADIGLDADLAKLAGWNGAKFHVNGFNIHGEQLTPGYVGSISPVSGNEALNHTRLYELWFEQAFGGNFSLRVGQIAADDEFFISRYTGIFVNSAFGWPPILGIGLPAGGPSYPLPALGARVKAHLSDSFTLLFGVFNGDAAGPGGGDPQDRDAHGLKFRLGDPPLMLMEVQYAYELDATRPGTLKLGGWWHTGDFNDQRVTQTGVPLGTPAGAGLAPSQHRGNFGPYAVLEQMLVPLGEDKGIAAFARVGTAQPDRNPIDFYADGGVNISGFSKARPDDSFAFGFSYARISSDARGFDFDALNSATGTVIRDYEGVFEAAYLAQVQRGVTLQPTLQYIVHPGGGAADPASASGSRIPNAVVAGMRLSIQWGKRDADSLQ